MANHKKGPKSGPIHPAIEILSIDDLVADPANPRAHPERNRKAVLGSVKRFGPWRSLAIDQGNVIYAGNETANACKEAGFTEVVKVTVNPGQVVAVCREDMTETEKTGYSIADNQTAVVDFQWVPELPAALQSLEMDGFDLSCLGFTDEELKGYLEHPENTGEPEPAPEPQIDRAAELQAKWKTARGQLWTIGDHRLLCGDSTKAEDVARVMGETAADIVITDPPYGIDLQNNDRDGHRRGASYSVEGDRDQLAGLAVLAWAEICKLPTIVFASPWKPWPGEWRNLIVWDKGGAVGGGGDIKTCLKRSWELIQVARNGPMNGPRDEAVWRHELSPQETSDHICSKPVGLMARLIERFTGAGQVIIDHFAGSGSTIVAAEETGRRCFGIEISPGYCAVILERLSDMGLEPRLEA